MLRYKYIVCVVITEHNCVYLEVRFELHFNFLLCGVGVHSASWASWSQLRSYLNEKVAAPGLENRENGRGDPLRW
jgi:hypothetical protein